MKYYTIENSWIRKVVGKYPPMIDRKLKKGKFSDPTILSRFFLKGKIEVEPLITNPILHKKAKLTDLIEVSGIGFTSSRLISTKLKDILEKFNCDDFQFFKSNVIVEGKEVEGYWQMFPINESLDVIDLEKSDIVLINRDTQKEENLKIDSDEHLKHLKKEVQKEGYRGEKESSIYVISIKKVVIKENINKDCFYLKHRYSGSCFYISEEVKNAIEEAGCTAVHHRPSHMTSEWRKYEEEKYGKY